MGDYVLEIKDTSDVGRIIEIHPGNIDHFLETYGNLPLPPYIEYSREKEKDYQSIFAKKDGSVAAPTASLHFTDALMGKLPCRTKNITLHIGLGTFQTINTNDIREYKIHSETASIPYSLFEYIFEEKKAGHPLLAVGTTVCRTLESLPALWRHMSPDFKSKLSHESQQYWDAQSQTSDPKWIENVSEQENEIQFSTRAYIFP